jgi:hypothetical protein
MDDHDLVSRLEGTVHKSRELIKQSKKLVQETEQILQRCREERLPVKMSVTCDTDEHYSSLSLIRQ